MSNVETKSLLWYEHVWAAFPLLLIAIGGMIGGMCGGLGYGLNAMVLKKDWPGAMKFVVTLGISVGAVVLYFVIAIGLVMLFPDVFGQKAG